jgi:hypothetical protein
LFGVNDDVSKDDAPGSPRAHRGEVTAAATTGHPHRGVRSPSCGAVPTVCAPELRRPLAMGAAMMLFQQLSGINAVVFFSGSIL